MLNRLLSFLGVASVAMWVSGTSVAQDIEPDLPTLIGDAGSFVLLRDGKVVEGHGEIGAVPVVGLQSLSIFAAYRDAIRSGKVRRTDMVFLEDLSRSPIKGKLHRWPDRIAVSVHSLVAIMMQDGDHTAMDAMTYILGRPSIELHAVENAPFLTTREMLILRAEEGLREAWTVSDASSREAILDEAARQGLPAATDLSDTTVADIAWRYPLDAICTLALDMSGDPEMMLADGVIEEAGQGLFSIVMWQDNACLAGSVQTNDDLKIDVLRQKLSDRFQPSRE